MTKMDFLRQLRCCTRMATLEKVVSYQRDRVSDPCINEFELAADHRRAEIVTGKLFDRVPKGVWRQVN